jgi:hypothetical protein
LLLRDANDHKFHLPIPPHAGECARVHAHLPPLCRRNRRIHRLLPGIRRADLQRHLSKISCHV